MMDEKIRELPDNKSFYIQKDDDVDYVDSDTYEYSHVNQNKKNFEDLLKWKGLAGWWAYQHGIGLYARRKLGDNPGETAEEASRRARARYIGQESWYDEDNYFWILTDKYPDYLLCQLRISNHLADFANYYDTHSHEPLGIVNCDSVLNLKIIDKQKIAKAGLDPKKGWVKNPSIEQSFNDAQWTMFSVEVTIDPDHPIDPVGMQLFEDFLKEVKEGKQPKITIDDIRQYVDPDAYVRVNEKYDDNDPTKLYVRQNQLSPRENLKPNQWTMAPKVHKDFTRYAIPRFADDPIPKSHINLDKSNPTISKGNECFYGKWNGKNVIYDTKKNTIKFVDKKGRPLGNGVIFVNPNESKTSNKNKLIESFDISPIYLHNIIMESIEKLL